MDELSPLTRAHKIAYIEANIIGSEYGDEIGRVYIRQLGTAVVQSIEDETQYYRFPERTGVLNPFFGSTRYFDPEIYQNIRFRDRPYANTAWELVFNQRDEPANQDVDLQAVTDIRLFVYYSDFTPF